MFRRKMDEGKLCIFMKDMLLFMVPTQYVLELRNTLDAHLEEEMELNKGMVDDLFKLTPVVKVVFTKRNRDRRVMICTKQLEIIPGDKHPTGESTRKPNPEICTVYEMGNDWRSFRYDSIISIEKVDQGAVKAVINEILND